MESILQDLIKCVRSASSQLHSDAKPLLQAALHDTEKLPDKNVSSLASEALDLLSDVQSLLEPGHLVLADHFLGYMKTKALCAVVELNIVDVLRSGPKTILELASVCDARADRLQQIMRTLHNNGIFLFDTLSGEYSNNHTSTLLLSDHWTQWRSWVDLYGNEFYDMARGIPLACQKDCVRSPAQINYDTDHNMFKYFTDQGWLPRFHKTLSGGAIAQAQGILEDYPWEEIAENRVVDVGGGGGGLIALLLRKYKTMEGAIFETPRVIEHARANFHGVEGQYADVGDQIPPGNLIAGDFFKMVVESEIYTMKWCLHDWDDPNAITILKNLRSAVRRSRVSRLVIFESVLKDGHVGRMSRYADMNMMVAVGGQERDEMQWRKLADQTGWELRRIFPLRNAWPCAIEFVPVWGPDEAMLADGPADTATPKKITAEMRFLEPWDSVRGTPYIRRDPAPGYDRMNFKWQDHSVAIQDARPTMGHFSVDVNGFAYYKDWIAQEIFESLRANEKEIIQQSYYPHVEQFAKRVTGGSRVIIFDHTMRKRRLELETTQNNDGKEQPATLVHCDQSEKGALRRLRLNIDEGEDADDLLRGRVQMINVWRPLNGPVRDWPLATMDYQSAKASDMHSCDLLKGETEELGQTATFTFSDRHKWFWLDEQQTDEVTVIKIWDSKTDGTSRFCAHTAFHDKNAPENSEPRESIEVRCLVIH